MSSAPPTLRPDLWTAIRRGLRLSCPNCGEAKLFRAYLKPVSHCPNCHEPWHEIRSELAPAWAAMTISAHVVIVLFHFVVFRMDLPNWQAVSILIIAASAIALGVLPSMKGMFMAISWINGASDAD